eukprot:TRINITY_DN21537_c0_g1_i1.p1 TRINITY_DN21537_c0_g1~~TRINITY_DN21537_c0_g1_i1.p1  ORF type:complete len:170 (-),score=29.81 TRINITY_DN21537_c0_g1_i1:602-1111(-)
MAQERRKEIQEETGLQPPEGPVLCANNCGYFGSVATMNMCSKCYKDCVLRQTKATAEKEEALQSKPDKEVDRVASLPGPSASSPPVQGDGGAGGTAAGEAPELPKGPTRCHACKKRVGLSGFMCRCGDTFCSVHRYSDKHECSFDYKAHGRDSIAKANPVVKADKIDKV